MNCIDPSPKSKISTLPQGEGNLYAGRGGPLAPCGRGKNFKLSLKAKLRNSGEGSFYIQTFCNISQMQICNSIRWLFIKLSRTVVPQLTDI